MKLDIVVAGVGGQGILTIAKCLSGAAMALGYNVKQAEVHGMSQRGGAVYANVRISDQEIYSDILAHGQADLIIAIEPMESLRYGPFLSEHGAIVSSTNAITNISDYPPIEELLGTIAANPNHILLDMERLGRLAGSPLAANVAAVGAASHFMDFAPHHLVAILEEMFSRKGDRVLETNRRAFRFGRMAGQAYRDAADRGADLRSVREFISNLKPEDFEAEALNLGPLSESRDLGQLTSAEAFAFEGVLRQAYDEGRAQLYEHEVYRLIEIVGAISPPKHLFVEKGTYPTPEALLRFRSDKVAIKLVSASIQHKSDVAAVAFVANTETAIRLEMDAMLKRHAGADVAGVLVVEFVDQVHRGTGSELFVGVRATREFGPVIAAGLGGVDTEFFASRMKDGLAVAKAVATEVTAAEFFKLFQRTAAYDLLAGNVRGHERIVSDGELTRCFGAFISIAQKFCVDRGEEGPDIGELEVNPFAFRHQKLVPLDGLARLGTATKARAPRNAEGVEAMLVPQSIALVGASAASQNFGRITLQNILKAGFDPQQIRVIHEKAETIDGVSCIQRIEDASDAIDLLVIASPNTAVPQIIESANRSGKVKSGIIISAGFNEIDGASDLSAQLQMALTNGENRAVFVGPNCMGIQSIPGHYNTFFVPEEKLGALEDIPESPVALISQSGAFVISRTSHLKHLKPRFSVTLGNQADVTVSDLVEAIASRDDIQVLAIYLEGFADLDGARFVRVAAEAIRAGKSLVFLKGGRTSSGQSAASGHTASVAGDYDICRAALEAVGVLVADDFQEFEQFVELASTLHHKDFGAGRIFAVSNAGMEAVGIADAIANHSSSNDNLLITLSPELIDQLNATLVNAKLDQMVSSRNPLDITPMANEQAYLEVVKTALNSPDVDVVIVSCVPLTPQLKTTEADMVDRSTLADLLPEVCSKFEKPVIFVMDAGGFYDSFADRVRSNGIPVFRTADTAGKATAKFILQLRNRSLSANSAGKFGGLEMNLAEAVT